jgi:hypothetical protein
MSLRGAKRRSNLYYGYRLSVVGIQRNSDNLVSSPHSSLPDLNKLGLYVTRLELSALNSRCSRKIRQQILIADSRMLSATYGTPSEQHV